MKNTRTACLALFLSATSSGTLLAHHSLANFDTTTAVRVKGAIVEVCGYVPKETTIWQIASADPAGRSLSGRLINAETLTMPDGREQSWGDYGVHKCFAAGYEDQHPTR